jgi:hypothetical protein
MSRNKSNDPRATKRVGNLPKAEKVQNAKPKKGVSIACAQRQNESLAPNGRRIRNVIPNNGLSVVTGGK